jgi:phage terminase large subunit-like protein
MIDQAAEPAWEQLARPWQRMPPGDWTTWLLQAGRGAGKTRAGAEATLKVAQEATRLIAEGRLTPQEARLAAIGPTATYARDVMVDGASGLLRCSSPEFAPIYQPSQRKLTYPGGVEVRLFGADEPDRLRGSNFMWVWFDGFDGARRQNRDALDNATAGLRAGPRPRRLIAEEVILGPPRSVTVRP